MTRLLRSCRGQASAEYVAVVLAVALLLAAGVAAAATLSPPFGRQVAATFRQGMCIVFSGVCTRADARAAGLEPCPVHVRRDEQSVGVEAWLVRVGHGNALVVERRSDGSVGVSFVDEEELGGQLKAGVRATPLGLDAEASAEAGVAFARGKTWEFPDQDRAAAFVRRYAGREGLAGEARGVGRSVGLGEDSDGPPPPPALVTYYEAGPYGELAGILEAGGDTQKSPTGGGASAEGAAPSPPELDGSAHGVAVLGRSRRGARTTWYLKVKGEVAAELGAVVGSLHAGGRGEAVIEVAVEDGRPVSLKASGSAAAGADLELSGGVSDLRDVRRRLAVGGRAGADGVVEADVSLDLRDPANHAAVAGLLQPGSSAQWRGRLRALAARLDAAGVANVRLYSLERREHGAQATFFGFGGGYTESREVRRLSRGWSLAGGGTLREREDCAEAAREDRVSG